jgi:hypothetical protein
LRAIREVNMKKLHAATIVVLALFCMLSSANAQTATPSGYLILQSIGGYDNDGKGKCGNGAGLLAATDHFGKDHKDTTCRTDYYSTAQDLAVSIQVSQHSGAPTNGCCMRWREDSGKVGKCMQLIFQQIHLEQ